MSLFWPLLIIIASIGVDQITKYIAVFFLKDVYGIYYSVLGQIVGFKYITNDGCAFGMFDTSRWLFMSVSSFAILGLLVFIFWKHKTISPLLRSGLSLITGGGIGNMIDRTFNGTALFQGEVIDFISFEFINFPVFNIADTCVTIGSALVFFYLIREIIKESKEKKRNFVR